MICSMCIFLFFFRFWQLIKDSHAYKTTKLTKNRGLWVIKFVSHMWDGRA